MYLLRVLYQFPPLCTSAAGILLLVSCIFVADGAEIGLHFSQNPKELAHGVRPGHADILILEHEEIAIPRTGLFLPRSAQVQLGQCLLIGQMVAINRNAPGD